MTERRSWPRSAAVVAHQGDMREHPLLTFEPLGLSKRPVRDDEDLRRRIRQRLDLVCPFLLGGLATPSRKGVARH